MSKTERRAVPNLHEQTDIFRSAVNFTAGQSGFSEKLVEKDYFCSLLLQYLTLHVGEQLVFKGGTSLAKIFFDFYRLSEDLDFIIPMPISATKRERSEYVIQAKTAIAAIPTNLPVFSIEDKLKGANGSRQYLATIGYTSFVDGQPQTIKLEIGLREPLMQDAITGSARTLLNNAANSQPVVSPFSLTCLSLREAMAEKFRAALSRREVAIRDFYDINYAALTKVNDFEEPQFINLVREKLAIPENDPPDSSDARLAQLQGQLETRLKPVLRTADFDAFKFDQSIAIVKNMHKKLEETKPEEHS